MGRTILVLASAMLVCVAILSSTASGTDPQPLDPTRAAQLATTGATRSPDADGRRVTPAQAVSLMGGLSTTATALAGQVCWFIDSLWSSWGTWPYGKTVREWRSWCAQYVGGPQTYRQTQVHVGTVICVSPSRYQLLISGGNGYRWSDVRTGAYFDCQTSIPWFTLHYNHWQQWSCNTQGHCAFTARSG
jgi:hypothetical protein